VTPLTYCTDCQRPVDSSTVLSTHHTSEGWVRYRRCACGHVSIELVSLDETAVVLV